MKNVYKNFTSLNNKLLAVYFKEYNDIIDQKKSRLMKNLILVIYLLKVLNMINGTKYIKKQVNHSQKKLLRKE